MTKNVKKYLTNELLGKCKLKPNEITVRLAIHLLEWVKFKRLTVLSI